MFSAITGSRLSIQLLLSHATIGLTVLEVYQVKSGLHHCLLAVENLLLFIILFVLKCLLPFEAYLVFTCLLWCPCCPTLLALELGVEVLMSNI